jgi:lipopolysaccharide transport system ATP-binding protein
MTKAEIRKQFDAIVDFAGVEQFLDTPVKRYSSGMYVRLAFAVAAHLESEILIVDEVLAVGDTGFQRKCLGKMKDVAIGGRTVLFVSHNMAAVEALCTYGLLLHHGIVQRRGTVSEVISGYQEALIQATASSHLQLRTDRSGNGRLRLSDFQLEDTNGRNLQVVRSGQDIVFAFQYECEDIGRIQDLSMGLSLGYGDHNLLSVFYNTYVGQPIDLSSNRGWIKCRVEKLPLAMGRYIVGARVFINSEEADWPRDGVGEITVEPGDFYGTGQTGHGSGAPLLLRGDWFVGNAQSGPCPWERKLNLSNANL